MCEACHAIMPIGVEDIFTGSIQPLTIHLGILLVKIGKLIINFGLILCLLATGDVYAKRSPRVKEVEGFNHQVINNSNIVICVYHEPFQESYLVSQ